MSIVSNVTMLAASETANLLQAFEQGQLGVSFGIAGFLIGYLAGAAYLLSELGVITPTTKIAGASSGALLSMALCSGIPADGFQSILQHLSTDCRQRSNCQGRLGAAVLDTIPKILPPDAYQRCRNRAFLSITTGTFPKKNPPNVLVTDFSNNADFTAAGVASSYIPMWSGSTATTTFRGQPAYDGFFSNSQPCPPTVKTCIKLSSRNPSWDNKKMDAFFNILNRTAHVATFTTLRLASLPTSQEGSPRGNQQQPARSDVAQAIQKAASMGVDLAPGLFSPTGFTLEAWEELLVLPGDAALNKYLWNLGRKDAQLWAKATGLEAAAAAKRASHRHAQGH